MNLILLAAILASASPPVPAASPVPPAPPAADATDLRCYRLMAELARSEDAEVHALGIAAAQFFLGRIDAAAPGTDLAAAPAIEAGERGALIRRCSDALDARGFDPASLGETLERPEPTV
jgi:hypothetical protein